MYHACLSRDKELISSLIKRGSVDFDGGMAGACYGGHKDLVLLMIEKGANNWNWGLSNACCSSHMDLALLMIQKGADDWSCALQWACVAKNKDLVILFIEKGANINYCNLELNEFDIEYLLYKKVKEFGKFKEMADLCMARRKLADQIFKELHLRDVDSIIYTY